METNSQNQAGTVGAIAPTAPVKHETPVYLPFGFSIGSREVEIKIIDRYQFLPKKDDIRDEVHKNIGSKWKAGTNDIIRGLSRSKLYILSNPSASNPEAKETIEVDEERKYMPKILGISAESEKFEEIVRDYWAEFGVKVPLLKGVKLQIGFTPNGEPINLKDYISYQWCIESGDVAISSEQLDNKTSEIYQFYCVDPKQQELAEMKKFESRKEVQIAYARLISSKNEQDMIKIDYILNLKGGPEGLGIVDVTKLQANEKHFLLEKVASAHPEMFASYIKDPSLGTRALIRKAINIGKMSLENKMYYLDGHKIGNLKETIAHLEDKNNVGDKEKIEIAIEDYIK